MNAAIPWMRVSLTCCVRSRISPNCAPADVSTASKLAASDSAEAEVRAGLELPSGTDELGNYAEAKADFPLSGLRKSRSNAPPSPTLSSSICGIPTSRRCPAPQGRTLPQGTSWGTRPSCRSASPRHGCGSRARWRRPSPPPLPRCAIPTCGRRARLRLLRRRGADRGHDRGRARRLPAVCQQPRRVALQRPASPSTNPTVTAPPGISPAKARRRCAGRYTKPRRPPGGGASAAPTAPTTSRSRSGSAATAPASRSRASCSSAATTPCASSAMTH